MAQVPICHWQVALQVSVCVPQLPHAEERVWLGVQAPSPVQAP